MLINRASLVRNVIGTAKRFKLERPSEVAPTLISRKKDFECWVNRVGQFRLQIAGINDDLRNIPVAIRHIESGRLTEIDKLFPRPSGYIAELAIETGFPREGEFEILVGDEIPESKKVSGENSTSGSEIPATVQGNLTSTYNEFRPY